nr:MAG TPA: DnaK suppressor protein [Caudoviricetes sp.]
MNVCEFCGKEIPRGRLCAKHLAMRVLLPVRYWQMVAKSANEAAIREQMDMEYEQRRSAEASKALTTERAEAEEAKENMESAMRALEQVRAELEQVRAELKEEHIRRLEEQMEVRNLEKVLAGRLLAEWKERKVPRTPLGRDAETCKRWMCEPKSCQAWLSCRGRLEPREQIRELTEAMSYASGTL